MPKKKPIKGKPKVNKELEGFEIEINEFGEIKSNFPIDRLNTFLDRNVKDKKLVDREDWEETEEGEVAEEAEETEDYPEDKTEETEGENDHREDREDP